MVDLPLFLTMFDFFSLSHGGCCCFRISSLSLSLSVTLSFSLTQISPSLTVTGCIAVSTVFKIGYADIQYSQRVASGEWLTMSGRLMQQTNPALCMHELVNSGLTGNLSTHLSYFYFLHNMMLAHVCAQQQRHHCIYKSPDNRNFSLELRNKLIEARWAQDSTVWDFHMQMSHGSEKGRHGNISKYAMKMSKYMCHGCRAVIINPLGGDFLCMT